MNKKSKKYIIAIILGFCLLSSCSSEDAKQSKENVLAFLTAYQAQDETCGQYLAGNEENTNVKFEGFQSILAEPIKFEINSVKEEKEYTIVNVNITNVDFGKVFEELANSDELQIDTTENIAAELKTRLQAEEAPVIEFEVPIKLNKENKIEMTSELSNALLGGYTQYIYELTEGDVQ